MIKDGMRSAAMWANTEMLEILAKKVNDSHQADTLLQTSDLHRILKEAVMSDSEEAVRIVKTIYENRHLKTADVEDIVNEAVQRGNRTICELLEIDPVKLKLESKQKLQYSIITRTAGIFAKVPKSGDDIDYNQEQISAKIRGLVETPDVTLTHVVTYEDLLQLKLPPVHYNIERDHKRDVGHLVPCPTPCPRPATCKTMQTPLLIADYIRVQLGKKEKLFASIPPPLVVGSLKENSRLFFFGENSFVDISSSR